MAKSLDKSIRCRGAVCVIGAFGAALAATSTPAAAQRTHPQPIVQPAPPSSLGDLNAALKDLSRDPANVSALLRAGWASLGLDDTQAALGFFRRAQAIQPLSGEIKAGIATASLRLDDPVAAVRLFAEAEATGTPMARFAGDRGLALDLVGNNGAAQQFYRQALGQRPDPEITRRLALSQAIAGDQSSAEATLLPLLQRRDLAAYRTRAFALAILGKGEDAVLIAQTMLPPQISNRMAPYLRYMPRLTRAQQAAAANLGQFPPASEIGRDNPQIAAISKAATPVQVASAAPGARLVPAGQPLGRSDRGSAHKGDTDKRSGKAQKADRKTNVRLADSGISRAEGSPSPAFAPLARQADASPPQVAAATRLPPATTPLPAMGRAPGAPPPAVLAATRPPAAAAIPTPATPLPSAFRGGELAAQTPPAVSKPVIVASLPNASLAPSAQAGEPSPAPAPATSRPVLVAEQSPPAQLPPPPAVEPSARPSLSISQPPAAAPQSERVSLADAFAEFAAATPETAQRPADAVDISRIKPARETKAEPPKPIEPKVKAKPKPPADPQRFWAQVATGRNVKALGFDWRRLQHDAGPLLSKREAYTARWGQTRRLLAGPYKSEDEADKAVAALKKKGIDAFEFTSDEGEEVAPLK